MAPAILVQSECVKIHLTLQEQQQTKPILECLRTIITCCNYWTIKPRDSFISHSRWVKTKVMLSAGDKEIITHFFSVLHKNTTMVFFYVTMTKHEFCKRTCIIYAHVSYWPNAGWVFLCLALNSQWLFLAWPKSKRCNPGAAVHRPQGGWLARPWTKPWTLGNSRGLSVHKERPRRDSSDIYFSRCA